MKLYPQKRVSAIGLISMTESQDVYLSFSYFSNRENSTSIDKTNRVEASCFKLTRNRERS